MPYVHKAATTHPVTIASCPRSSMRAANPAAISRRLTSRMPRLRLCSGAVGGDVDIMTPAFEIDVFTLL